MLVWDLAHSVCWWCGGPGPALRFIEFLDVVVPFYGEGLHILLPFSVYLPIDYV
ncbi:MAG: hypothetical protein ACFB14_14000 [Leptolyngbyaceae cyanobacterium]